MRRSSATAWLLAVAALLAACSDNGLPILSPRLEDAPRQPVTLRVTQYYTALEEDYPPGDGAPFLSAEGDVLYDASDAFYRAAVIEGSARLADGTVLNWDRKVGDHVKWKAVTTTYGLAADGCALVPWRTAAVDPDVVPLGTRIRIEETIGMPLPDGSRHDGVWWANDIGVSIDNDRIDLFTGSGKASMDPSMPTASHTCSRSP